MLRFAYTSQHSDVLFYTVASKCVDGTWTARQGDGWGVDTFLSLHYVQITANPVIVMEIPNLHPICNLIFIHHTIVSGEYFVM